MQTLNLLIRHLISVNQRVAHILPHYPVQLDTKFKLTSHIYKLYLAQIHTTQWRIQDLEEGGARLIAREKYSHTPKTLTTPLIYAFLKIAG